MEEPKDMKIVEKLPKTPAKGEVYTLARRKRLITFQATGKKFPKWKIISNVAE